MFDRAVEGPVEAMIGWFEGWGEESAGEENV